MVEDIEGIRTELDLRQFPYREGLHECRVKIPLSRAVQTVAGAVSQLVVPRVRKVIGVEPFPGGLRSFWVADAVGEGPSFDAAECLIAAGPDGLGRAGVDGKATGVAPAADDLGEDATIVQEVFALPDSRDVGCYLGLRPRRSQSGDHDPQLGITHADNAYLRSLLIECSNHILRPHGRDSALRQWPALSRKR